MTDLLFSYGTLQLDSVQLSSFGRLLDGEDDVLHGFDIVDIQIRDPAVLGASGIEIHKGLVPATGEAKPIPGKVFRLSRAELAAADVYESENYRRIQVPLASGKRAWVYVKA